MVKRVKNILAKIDMLPYNKKLNPLARRFRKNMTYAERLLWSKIRNKQLKNLQFYRQRVIENFIVDFYCPKAKLVIELDGGQHYTCKGRTSDVLRDRILRNLGIRVLRFSDREVVENLKGVIQKIYESL